MTHNVADEPMPFDLVHGVRVDDPFRWLEERQSSATVAWLATQAAGARRYLDALPGHAELIADAARLLATETVEGLSLGREATFFLRRAPEDHQASVWMQGADGSERLLVNAGELDPSGRTSLEILAVARNDRVLAYGKRAGCQNEYAVAFFDLSGGETLPDQLSVSEYRGVVLAPDATGVYYAAPHHGSWRIAWHRFGRSTADDDTIFLADGPAPLKLGLSLAHDDQHLLVLTARRGPPRTMDLHVLPLGTPRAPRTLLKDTPFFGGGVTCDGHFYYLTHEGASRRRVMRASLDGDGTPCVVVSESDDVIRRIARTRDRLLLVTSANGRDRVRVFGWDGTVAETFEPTDVGKIIHVATHPQRQDFYLAIESWRQPRTIVRFNASTPAAAVSGLCTAAARPRRSSPDAIASDGGRTLETWWARAAPIDPDALVLEECACTARDGERLFVYLVRTKAPASSQTATEGGGARRPLPTLLVAYGGYGISTLPTLSLRNALWLAAGGQLAVTGVRGGGEQGRDWHEAGARENRQTAIDDLIDAADWLIAERRTTPHRLALAGASHAGTLVAAAMTQRPNQFAAVICSMALLDLVRFESSSHGRWSAQEVGTIADASQFRALLSYSPYHNVRDGVAYPAVLFISGDADTLIDPFHVRKMAARLQRATGSGRPVLLSYDEHRGHRGQLPLSERARSLADQIAFLRAQTGADERGRA